MPEEEQAFPPESPPRFVEERPDLYSSDEDEEKATYSEKSASPRQHLETYSSLRIWLQARGLGQYYAPLRDMGAKKVSDLAHLTPDDLKEMNLDDYAIKTMSVVVA